MAIALPKKPLEDDYEDLLSATLLSLGYFCERALHLRTESADVLELDVLASPSGVERSGRIVFEAKSGKTGLGDLFKIFGWMTYTGINGGCLVRSRSIEEYQRAAFDHVSDRLGIAVREFELGKHDLTDVAPPATDVEDKLREAAVTASWYGMIGQRACAATLRQYVKSNAESDLAKSASEYRWAVEQSVFAESPLQRATSLYVAWQSSPNLTGEFVAALAMSSQKTPEQVWTTVRDESGYLWLQRIMMLEHTARLGIVKNALDHIIRKEEQAEPGTAAEVAIDWSDFVEWQMPQSFREGIEELRVHPQRSRVPYLLQIFVELFGGFYRLDSDDDIRVLSEMAEMPIESVVPALDLMNKFFPATGGWFISAQNELAFMKMVPAVYRGTGCFFRTVLLGLDSYNERYPKMGFLLGRWHSALYNVLEKKLKAD